MNVDVKSGPTDWSRKNPWRAAGTAPVSGSGCGIAGGSKLKNMTGNGGVPPPGYNFGDDYLTQPKTKQTTWKRGQPQMVAWAALANHGGGYSWRLCKADGTVDEACFQANTLRFSGNTSWIRYGVYFNYGNKMPQIPDVQIPLVRVTEGTFPLGSEWARNPIPACKLCTTAAHAACTDDDVPWLEQNHCSQQCSGLNMSTCPPGMVQFQEPASGLSGFDPMDGTDYLGGFRYSIMDEVEVPSALPAGEYLLSWRWDVEQSQQIWQGCADIVLV